MSQECEQKLDDARRYATRLLNSLAHKHYPDRPYGWSPLHDLLGVLTQIDNLTAGMAREPTELKMARRSALIEALEIVEALLPYKAKPQKDKQPTWHDVERYRVGVLDLAMNDIGDKIEEIENELGI